MTEQEFISKVRSLMNEIGEDETFSLISDDTVKLDQYIKSCIEESINFVYMSCSVDYLPKRISKYQVLKQVIYQALLFQKTSLDL